MRNAELAEKQPVFVATSSQIFRYASWQDIRRARRQPAGKNLGVAA
jgi:hypothetical protein